MNLYYFLIPIQLTDNITGGGVSSFKNMKDLENFRIIIQFQKISKFRIQEIDQPESCRNSDKRNKQTEQTGNNESKKVTASARNARTEEK